MWVFGAELLHQKLLGVEGGVVTTPQTSRVLRVFFLKNAGKLSFLTKFKGILTKLCHYDKNGPCFLGFLILNGRDPFLIFWGPENIDHFDQFGDMIILIKNPKLASF